MNVRKTIFSVGGIGIILILLAVRLGWFSTFQKPDPAPERLPVRPAVKSAEKPETAPKSKKTAVSAEKKQPPAAVPPAKTEEKELLGSGDPFTYSTAGNGDYTPLSSNKNVGTITVKGIIRIDGEEPKAILYLKETDRIHYVSKDSVVRVSTKNKNGTSPAETYIAVKDIRNDEVELIQLERPDKVIIIR